MKTAILAIVLFCIMIFPHELGHFIVARKCGVQVNEFSFGMGPAIWKKQKGETLYAIRLFPIGGYCALEGEDGEDDEEDAERKSDEIKSNPRAFCNKKPWQKIAVLFAGSFMNLLCAFLILTITVGAMGFTTTTIGEVSGPSLAAGIEPGDKIVEINGVKVKEWADVSREISKNGGEELTISVQHYKNAIRDKKVTPIYLEDENRYIIGITSKPGHNPIKAIKAGGYATWNVIKLMFQSLDMIFSGKATMDDISGPVGIVQLVDETSNEGFSYFAFLMALICVNLAVINLLPLPALDGGRIIFVLYSWITGREVSQKVEGTVHLIGIVLLLALAVLITFNDIGKIIGH